MARKRRIASARALATEWEEYKAACDSYSTTCITDTETTTADGTEAVRVERTETHPVSYTIVGFCAHLGISRAAWYATYERDPRFVDIVARIHTECEVDVRRKFETGQINSRLAPLWMSKYGYGARVEATTEHKADNNLLDAIRDSLDALSDEDEAVTDAV